MEWQQQLDEILHGDFVIDDGVVSDPQGFHVALVEGDGLTVSMDVSTHLADEQPATLVEAAEILEDGVVGFEELGLEFGACNVTTCWSKNDPSQKRLLYQREGIARTASIEATAKLIRAIAQLDTRF